MLGFQERQKGENVDIPFIFHGGETLGDGTEADNNLYDAVLLGTKRIGHGWVILEREVFWRWRFEIDIHLSSIRNWWRSAESDKLP